MLTYLWGNYNPGALWKGIQNGAATMEISMVIPHKIKNRITI
jgi:hypothetical protein